MIGIFGFVLGFTIYSSLASTFPVLLFGIKKALLDGAKGYDDLVKSMRLGVLCSACIGDAKKVVEQLQNEIEEEKNRGTV